MSVTLEEAKKIAAESPEPSTSKPEAMEEAESEVKVDGKKQVQFQKVQKKKGGAKRIGKGEKNKKQEKKEGESVPAKVRVPRVKKAKAVVSAIKRHTPVRGAMTLAKAKIALYFQKKSAKAQEGN